MLSEHTKTYLLLTAAVLVLVYVSYAFMNTTGYLDLTGACQIDIEGDVVRGNEDTIRAALRAIKREDRRTYRRVCARIETISERFCIDADWHLDRARVDESARQPGCWLAGTDVIYLKPERGSGPDIVRSRADAITAVVQLVK